MKKILLIIAFAASLNASEKQALLQKVHLDEITTDHLSIKKSRFSDAKHFIELVSDYEVSRCIFGAEATQEQVKKLADSWINTKLFVPFMFALPASLKGVHRWMIRKDTVTEQGEKKNEVIGTMTIGNISIPEVVDLIKKSDPQHYENYMNLSLLLKQAEWNKGYARESITALLSKVFVAQEFAQLKGLILLTSSDNKHCIKCLMNNEQEAKKPFTYQGEINLPNGFIKFMRKECVLKFFMLKKDDFLNQHNNGTSSKS